jgi:hypothetical protein
LTSFQESAALQLPPSESDGRPLDSARSIPSASVCSSGALVVTAGFPCQDLSIAGRQAGLEGPRSSLGLRLIGLLSKTSTTLGDAGCPSCGAGCGPSGMPLCRFECEPLTLERCITEPEGGWLPTPTASPYGSCRGGGAGRVGKWRLSLHARGILHPEDWERMMGYPIQLTNPDAEPWAMRSCQRAPK